MDSNLVKNQYSLSIRICSDGFSLSVYDENNHIISSKHLKSEPGDDEVAFLQQMLASQEEINVEYKEISVICESAYHTLLPEIFHTTDKEEDFLKLQHPTLPTSCQIFHAKQTNLQTVLIFGIDKKIIEIVTNYFQSAAIVSHLVHIIRKIISEETEKLTLWVRAEEIDCVVYKNDKIILLNKYSFQNSEDIVYHILNIYEQLALNPSKFITEVYDDSNRLNAALLKDYIHTVNIKSKQSVYEDYQWKI